MTLNAFGYCVTDSPEKQVRRYVVHLFVLIYLFFSHHIIGIVTIILSLILVTIISPIAS